MSKQRQQTTTSGVNDRIEVPVINECENQATTAGATFVCNTLDWIQNFGNQIFSNSEEKHFFRCPNCKEVKYVSTPFRMFLNFPVCINCSMESLQEHR